MPKLFVKNMVCNRCIAAVRQVMEAAGAAVRDVRLGEVELAADLTATELAQTDKALAQLGFERIADRKSRTIERIKNIVIDMVHHQDGEIRQNLSDLLAEKLQRDYGHLSSLFSEVEGTTIEKYFIAQKIEKVKELLVYDELSLGEIAHRLSYSSPAYLSNQFKKVTGLTPSHFKQIGQDKRKPLDQI